MGDASHELCHPTREEIQVTRWLLLAGAITSEVTGSLALKGALDHPSLYALVALGFTSAFAFLTGSLRHGIPLGVAYGIWAAAGVALTAILSRMIYDEPFTPVMAIGLALIIGGVLLVEIGAPHTRANTTPGRAEAS